MNYQDYLLSDDWKQKRAQKRRRNNRCAVCAATENLDVHHLNYRGLYDVQQSDLRVLCRRCHYIAHILLKCGKYSFTSQSHHSRFSKLKSAVKKELGLTNHNLFKKAFLPLNSSLSKTREQESGNKDGGTRPEQLGLFLGGGK